MIRGVTHAHLRPMWYQIFPKPVTDHELFFAVSYSKPALVNNLLYQFKVCGPNAECRARIHRPLCFCPNGFQGNPHVACEETPSRAGLRFKRQLERDYYVYKDYDDDYKNYQ